MRKNHTSMIYAIFLLLLTPFLWAHVRLERVSGTDTLKATWKITSPFVLETITNKIYGFEPKNYHCKLSYQKKGSKGGDVELERVKLITPLYQQELPPEYIDIYFMPLEGDQAKTSYLELMFTAMFVKRSSVSIECRPLDVMKEIAEQCQAKKRKAKSPNPSQETSISKFKNYELKKITIIDRLTVFLRELYNIEKLDELREKHKTFVLWKEKNKISSRYSKELRIEFLLTKIEDHFQKKLAGDVDDEKTSSSSDEKPTKTSTAHEKKRKEDSIYISAFQDVYATIKEVNEFYQDEIDAVTEIIEAFSAAKFRDSAQKGFFENLIDDKNYLQQAVEQQQGFLRSLDLKLQSGHLSEEEAIKYFTDFLRDRLLFLEARTKRCEKNKFNYFGPGGPTYLRQFRARQALYRMSKGSELKLQYNRSGFKRDVTNHQVLNKLILSCVEVIDLKNIPQDAQTLLQSSINLHPLIDATLKGEELPGLGFPDMAGGFAALYFPQDSIDAYYYTEQVGPLPNIDRLLGFSDPRKPYYPSTNTYKKTPRQSSQPSLEREEPYPSSEKLAETIQAPLPMPEKGGKEEEDDDDHSFTSSSSNSSSSSSSSFSSFIPKSLQSLGNDFATDQSRPNRVLNSDLKGRSKKTYDKIVNVTKTNVTWKDFQTLWENLGGAFRKPGSGGSHRSLIYDGRAIGGIFVPHTGGSSTFGKRQRTKLRAFLLGID